MNRKMLDGITIIGLIISAIAVVDQLARWDNMILVALYFVWGVASAAMIAVILLAYNVRKRFFEACRGGSPLLWLRLLLSVALLLLGWYINAASEQLYGADSVMVANNGVRMFCVLFTMVFHVMYFGFTKKKTELR